MALPALEVSDLACRRGGRAVFEHLSLTLGAGELLALTGRNGSGKTTLLRALALLVPADHGSIRWQGEEVRHDADRWRSALAWLGHLDGLKGDLTVRENLVTANRLRGGSRDVDAALAAFDLVPLEARPARTLSAGQRRRSALARVAASGAEVWLLDEPLNALDAPSHKMLLAALDAHLAGGGLAIAATHAPIALGSVRGLELGT
jgi:heme exporter protein A